MNFKDILTEDNKKTFMNPNEFGEIHMIAGREMTIIIDNNEMIEREKRRISEYRDGIFKKNLLLYVRGEEFGRLPSAGRSLEMDGKIYIVTDAVDENGIYSVSLEAKRS